MQIAECGEPEVAEQFMPMIHFVFSNLKTWLNGIHHGVSAKHLQGPCHGAPGLRRSRWPGSRTRMNKVSYSGYRFPPEIIQQAIWLYLRFTLSLRDVEDLLAERGVAVSYETVRRWVNHFGPMIAADLRKRRLKPHTTWHLDEVYLKIDGRMVYLWRGRRRRGRGPRCAGPVQAKQARRAETDAQAPEEVCLCSSAVGHRRLAFIQRRGSRSWDRSPARARAMEEQSS